MSSLITIIISRLQLRDGVDRRKEGFLRVHFHLWYNGADCRYVATSSTSLIPRGVDNRKASYRTESFVFKYIRCRKSSHANSRCVNCKFPRIYLFIYSHSHHSANFCSRHIKMIG
ncbi:Toll-like receptor [Dirofilaria immitis]